MSEPPNSRVAATPVPAELAERALARQKAAFPDLDLDGVRLRLAIAAFIAEATALFDQLYAPMGSHARFTIVNGLVTLPEERFTPKDIAAVLGVRSATLAPILAGLEREGWIARAPHERDRRSHYVVLAPGAAERFQTVMREHVARTAPAAEGVSAEDYAEMRAGLDRALRQLRRMSGAAD